MVSRVAPASPVRRVDGLSGWDGSLGGAHALQSALAAQVQLSDGYPRSIRTVGGFSATALDGGRVVRAAGVVLDAQTLQPLYRHSCDVATQVPYVRELLGFRVLPALLRVAHALPIRPDVSLVDGHGVAHPRRFGLASHFGIASGLATVGVGRAALSGGYDEPGSAVGDRTRVFDGDQQVGWALRTRSGAGVVFISPGHLVSLAGSLELALRFQARHRLPEPVHLAAKLAGPVPAGAEHVRSATAAHRPHSLQPR